MTQPITTAGIAVERNDARTKHGQTADEYDVILRDPSGDLPPNLYETVDEHVREHFDLSQLADGETRHLGTVVYDADEVQDICIVTE